MKKIALWSVSAILVFLFFVVVKLPASHVLYYGTLPNTVQIGKVSGTLWNGKTEFVQTQGLLIERLSWKISAWPLLLGKIKLHLKGGNAREVDAVSISGPVTLSLFNMQHIEADNLTLYLPANQVIAKAKLPIRVNMGGRIKLDLDELSFGPVCEEIKGTGQWINASVALPQSNANLGNFSAALSCSGDDIQMEVKEPNRLGLSFVSVIPANFKKVRVNGRFKIDDDLPKEIHQAAQFFGNPDAQGYTTIKL